MTTYTIERACGEDPHDPAACYYRVMSSDQPLALASFDTKRQAEAFIEGLTFNTGTMKGTDK